ncbi:MAG TPA: CPBP family glutamic-type intramembrane protease [Anaerolineales bacterium]|nr:CPBP family glutamic-type intramembrane protease [Anaerolineales bacterium]
MKWLTPILPYLAVGIGLFWFQHAWAALLGFHLAIVISLLLARAQIPVPLLFKSKDIRWVILSSLLCGSSGISLYFLWHSFGVASILPAQLESLRLTKPTWPFFILYFVLVNPLIEEYFWRGYLGSPARGLYISDFLYAGFHALILIGKVQMGSVIYSLIVLVLAGWLWRQIAREDQGLLAPVLGHMAADFTILMAVYRMST